MRYQNWDVLVFPDSSRIPMQEFKTSCQVIQDPESHNAQANPHLLPTVTSFMPGLPTGSPFRVSIHCWQNPEVSRYILNLRRTLDSVLFEARVFIDGRIAGSKWFKPDGPWPTVLESSINLDKNGDFERLKFPAFHKELLSQSYWNPGDDLGRVKVLIAEGFARENLTYPFERVKNIVSFSFQHAPLDVLESSSIAWPNAAMWRQVSFVGPYFSQQFSPEHEVADIEAHSHSPRRISVTPRHSCPAPTISSMAPPPAPIPPRQPTFDPFTEPVHAAFHSWRQTSGDVSMPDYSRTNTRAAGSRQFSDPMQMSSERSFQSLPTPDHYDALLDAFSPQDLLVPTNTPRANSDSRGNTPPVLNSFMDQETQAALNTAAAAIAQTRNLEDKSEGSLSSTNLSPSLNTIKSRKIIPSASLSSIGTDRVHVDDENTVRKSSMFITTNNSGTKRSRVVTPAAIKAIDNEDEPRATPSIRQVSIGTLKQENKEANRKVLGEIEHN